MPSCVLNLGALCVWLELIEIESLLSCPFPLSGFYPCRDLVIGVNYRSIYSTEFWLLFKIHVIRNVHFNYFFNVQLLGLECSLCQKHLVVKNENISSSKFFFFSLFSGLTNLF